MYFKRNYQDPFFGQEFSLKTMVMQLLEQAKRDTHSQPKVMFSRQLKHGKSAGDNDEKIDWKLELFQYKAGEAPQRGFLLLPHVVPKAGSAPSDKPENQIQKLWVVYGGNAMLALDWVDIIDAMSTTFDADSLAGLLKSPLLLEPGRESIVELLRKQGLLMPETRDKSHSTSKSSGPGIQLDAEKVNALIAEGKTSTGFVLLDYPGYGLNQGGGQAPTQDSIFASTKAALEHVIKSGRFNDNNQVQFAAMGHSIGCAAVLDFQKRELGTAVAMSTTNSDSESVSESGPVVFSDMVLSAPFTSIPDMGGQLFPVIPRAVLDHIMPPQHAWRNDEALKFIGRELQRLQQKSTNSSALTAPVLRFAHGIDDEICPYWMSKQLIRDYQSSASGSSNLNEEVAHVEWKNTGHNDLLDRAWRLYATWMFLAQGQSKL